MTLDPTDPTGNLRASIAYTRETYGVSEEAAEFRRRRGPDKIIEPTEADWDIYRAGCDAMQALDDNEYITVWEPADFEEPKPRHEPGDYTETEDEWIARCKATLAKNGAPDNLDRVLSIEEFQKLGLPTAQHRRDWWRRGDYPASGTFQYLSKENDQ